MTFAVPSSWPPAPGTEYPLSPSVALVLAPNASSWTYEGTNSYVVSHGNSSLLVDPGTSDQDHLDILRDLGQAKGRSVSAVVLTHDHPDHSDGARELARAVGAPIVSASARFADEIPRDEQQIDLDGLNLCVLRTPGHSDDSICLWIPEDGLILTGDTLFANRSSVVMGDLGELFDSFDRIRSLVIDREVLALPGHGPTFSDPVDAITRILEVRQKRIAETRALIEGGASTLKTLIARTYPKLTGSRAMFGAPTVISTVRYIARLEGGRGIADENQRARILADIDAHERRVAE